MSEQPGLSLWVRLLFRRYRFLLLVSFLSGVLTLVVVFLMPKWYTARATILPPHEDTPSFQAMNQFTASLQLDRFLPFTEQITLSDIYLAIMDSDTVARRLIERFDLAEYYGQSTMVKTMKELRSRSTVAPTLKRVLEVKVEDKDPQMAADLANAYVEELDTLFRETRSTAGKRQRLFLETRVEEERADIDSLDVALADMQKEEGVTALAGGLTEAATAAGELLGRRLALAVQLEVLDETGIASGPARRQLELELDALDRKIARLPELGLGIARGIRDLRMHEFLYEELIKQLEAAKIEEARNTPAVEILERGPASRSPHPAPEGPGFHRRGVPGILPGLRLGGLHRIPVMSPAGKARRARVLHPDHAHDRGRGPVEHPLHRASSSTPNASNRF